MNYIQYTYILFQNTVMKIQKKYLCICGNFKVTFNSQLQPCIKLFQIIKNQ